VEAVELIAACGRLLDPEDDTEVSPCKAVPERYLRAVEVDALTREQRLHEHGQQGRAVLHLTLAGALVRVEDLPDHAIELEAGRDRGYPLPDARIGDHHRLMIGGAAAGANGYARLEARAGGRRAGGRIAPTNLLCCGHDGYGRFRGDDTMLLRVSTFSVVWGLLREALGASRE
jgi:hypothetical protein